MILDRDKIFDVRKKRVCEIKVGTLEMRELLQPCKVYLSCLKCLTLNLNWMYCYWNEDYSFLLSELNSNNLFDLPYPSFAFFNQYYLFVGDDQ